MIFYHTYIYFVNTTSNNNKEYSERENYWINTYYQHSNINMATTARYGSKFDAYEESEKVFASCETINFYNDNAAQTKIKYTLENFLDRFRNRGFSDQQNVADDMHKLAYETADKETKMKYGNDFDKYRNGVICKRWILYKCIHEINIYKKTFTLLQISCIIDIRCILESHLLYGTLSPASRKARNVPLSAGRRGL